MDKINIFLKDLKDRLLVLPPAVRYGIIAAVVLLVGAILFGVYHKLTKPKPVVIGTYTPKQLAGMANQPSPAPAAAPTPAPAPATAPAPVTAAPVVAPPPVTASPTTVFGQQGAQAAPTFMPAWTDDTKTASLIDRDLQIDNGTGPMPFMHDQQNRLSLASDSSHGNGDPRPRSYLVAHYQTYAKIPAAGTYSLIGRTSGGARHEVALFVNDTQVSDVARADESRNGQYGVTALTKEMNLVPGFYKFDVVIRQEYQHADPVGFNVKLKQGMNMLDLVPGLPVEVEKAPAPAQMPVPPSVPPAPAAAGQATPAVAAPVAAAPVAVPAGVVAAPVKK